MTKFRSQFPYFLGLPESDRSSNFAVEKDIYYRLKNEKTNNSIYFIDLVYVMRTCRGFYQSE